MTKSTALESKNKDLFYQNHLDQVSRSFALTISELNQPLRYHVGLSYLLFRIIDTIEDTENIATSDKINLLNILSSLLSQLKSMSAEDIFKSEDFTILHQGFNQLNLHCTPSEALLMKDFKIIFSDLAKLENSTKTTIINASFVMISGIIEHLQLFPEGQVKLNNMTELNHYCYYVAGVVGEMLTELVSAKNSKINFKSNQGLAIHFGLFLQKINILKDHVKDQARGVIYFQNKSHILESLKNNLTKTMSYIQNIPADLKDYKLFCLFSATLGAFSLYQMNQTKKTELKREDVKNLFFDLKKQIELNSEFNLIESILFVAKRLNLKLEPLMQFIDFNPLEISASDSSNSLNQNSRYSVLKNYPQFEAIN